MLLPLLVAAGEEPCLLCTKTLESTQASTAKATPLSIDITTQLDFSRAALSGSSGGQIDVDPHNGSRRVDGSIIDLGGPAFAGTAIVRGEPGRAAVAGHQHIGGGVVAQAHGGGAQLAHRQPAPIARTGAADR